MKMAKSIVFIAQTLEVEVDTDISDKVWGRCRIMVTNQIRQDFLRAIGFMGTNSRIGLPRAR